MADSDQETTPQAPQQQFAIQRIYTKDISFETPNSPTIFREKWQPDINVELNAAAQPLEENVFEVVLSVTVTAKAGEKTAYLVEVQQAGIFAIAGFGEQEREAMLYSFCPNILFPYAREVVTNLITKGSFPQMVLSPVNFDALYARHMAQKQEQGGDKPVH